MSPAVTPRELPQTVNRIPQAGIVGRLLYIQAILKKYEYRFIITLTYPLR